MFENEKNTSLQTVKVKMGLPCMFTKFSLYPAHFYFAQGLVVAKIDKIPLAHSRIVRYNSGISRQSRNSHIAQVQFRNCSDSHFALNIYIHSDIS